MCFPRFDSPSGVLPAAGRALLSHVDGGVTARGGAEWLVLSSLAGIRLAASTATATAHAARQPDSAGEPSHDQVNNLTI
jgi:hypothetical protein